MIGTDETSAALVDWINSFPIDPKISSLDDLSDGKAIAQVLLDIDPLYFRQTGHSQDSSPEGHWVNRFHKLKKIHKDLTNYYTGRLGHRLPANPPNLTLIAKDAARDETIKLVKIIVAAAVQSERKNAYIQHIQSLSPKSQTELMMIINQMIQLDDWEELEPVSDRSLPHDSYSDDNEFRMEEEIARLASEKEAVEAEKNELHLKLKQLQIAFDDNQDALERLREQIGDDNMNGDGYARADAMLRAQMDHLQSDVTRLEDILLEKEAMISANESTIASLTRKIDDLTVKADKAIKLKDEVDEAHHLIEKLRKGQNVAEKYRKKLEGMSEMERQMKSLEAQNSQLMQSLRQSEETSKQVHGLRKLVDTYKKQIEKLESDHAETLRAKQRMEIEFATTREKLDGADAQKSKDMEQIHLLEERVRELETGAISSSGEDQVGASDLNSELNFTTKTKADLKLKISNLEAEVARLKGGSGATSADNMVLKNQLEDAQKSKAKLEQDYMRSHTEKLVLESQLAALRDGGPIDEGSAIVLKLRQSLADQESDLNSTRKRLTDVESTLNATKRELASAKADLSLVDKDKLEALQELKVLASAELVELRQEHALLQQKCSELEVDVSTKQSLLNTILLEKDALAKHNAEHKDDLLEKERAIGDLRATLAALEGNSEGRDAALEKRVVQLQNKVEDQREKLTKNREHIKKLHNELRERDEQIEKGIGERHHDPSQEIYDAGAMKQLQAKLEHAQHENRLIMSAYYDLSSRLQTNTVALVRRAEPCGFLGKQRAAVHSPVKK